MTDFLSTSIHVLPQIGTRRAELLAQEIGVSTLRDLLYYYPYRYIDRRRIYAIEEIVDGMPEVQILAQISRVYQEGVGKSARLVVEAYDATGKIQLVWFRGFQYIAQKLQQGQRFLFFGKPQLFNHSFSIVHPEIMEEGHIHRVSGGLFALYRTTEKMKKMGMDSRFLREKTAFIFSMYKSSISDILSPSLLQKEHLMARAEALRAIHFPSSVEELNRARHRLKFDELFFLQLHMRRSYQMRKAEYKGVVFGEVGERFHAFYQSLPFPLTSAQKRVVREIRLDTWGGKQMNRLVQGDVGSGKTLVALLAMLLAVDNGYQACMMAPTEILAHQHAETIANFLKDLPIRVELLTGNTTARERTRILSLLKQKEIGILIGTHALLEDRVAFGSLGLAVIDEQHRFGVSQRAVLWNKNKTVLPHILIMSATPIPRTLAMTLYGDLDLSIIDELPPGRKPITTLHLLDQEMPQIMRFIHQTIRKGQQVYVVYPMIEGNEGSEWENVTTGYQTFFEALGEKNVTFVHGKLPPKEKEKRMQEFASGKIPILLSTTVIEVGVNVPNASVMVILDAQRFGLSQLHQLRGRVGRGSEKSYCILVTKPLKSAETQRRIEVMVETQDGFRIAEEDMKLRGFGDLEGVQQSGDLPGLSLAHPVTDSAIVLQSRRCADEILQADPTLSEPQNSPYWEELKRIRGIDMCWGKIS